MEIVEEEGQFIKLRLDPEEESKVAIEIERRDGTVEQMLYTNVAAVHITGSG